MSLFHVSSVRNRASIREHGLDWRQMGAAPGIAGSRKPEQQGVFFARGDHERRWFVGMNNTGGPVDVWQVDGVDPGSLVIAPEGYAFLPGTVAPDQVTWVETVELGVTRSTR